MSSVQKKLDLVLPRIEKPARYIGGEPYSVIREPAEDVLRFCFCFADSYEIGMSYMGMQILYNILNKSSHTYCERAFTPAEDMIAEMEKEDIPLFTIETKTPLAEMDMIGFTLQYELGYSNILLMLKLAGVPVNAKDRGEDDPLVVAGGPCAFNPEPLADFFDAFMVGDGENDLAELCELAQKRKTEGFSKDEFLRRASKIEGVYIPSFYEPEYGEDGRLLRYKKLWDGAPDRVLRAFIQDLDYAVFPEENIVPLTEIVHDRSVVEIMRGCTRGCRFCQAGMIYRPVRERSKEKIYEIGKRQLESSGNSELSVLSLSTSDHSDFEAMVMKLMNYCGTRRISLSLPSLRLDNFAFKIMDEMQGLRKTGLTFAPEAGTQRLRDVINKNITEEEIFTALDKAIELGWNNVKLYFMIGLPTETDEDIAGIPDLARRIMDLAAYKNGGRRGRFSVSVSVANFIPKPFTPFQWCAQDTEEEFERKHTLLKKLFKDIKGVSFHYHGSYSSHLEAIFARGGRELCETLRLASDYGCRFDAWTEQFNEKAWRKALIDSGIDLSYFALNEIEPGAFLPWNIIDSGVTEEYLLSEYERAMGAKTTKDCRYGCNGCGINRHVECRWGGIYE
ncbi:MAG: TIGR03960 family B12-binding radical SAM protein [Firmicutes bacterium]|nr:TIGR03960 family B12-binding radical SAM protein [Bacillota bacterium]